MGSSLDGRYAFGTEDVELPSPIGEIRVIGAIYFPELSAEIKEVVVTSFKYKGAIHTLAAERHRNNGASSADANDRINEVYVPLSDAVHRLTQKAEIIANGLS